jgi:amino acid adenylation domain-containing protein
MKIAKDFYSHARYQPAGTCILFGEEVYTWSESANRVRALREELKACGVGFGSRVVVHLPRSPEVVFSLLAILELGAVYVPCPVDYPAERAAHIIKSCDAALVLTCDPDLVGKAGISYRQLNPKKVGPNPTENDTDGVGGSGNQESYIIFTSGSTGEPKGVVNSVAGIENRIRWQRGKFDVKSTDIFLSKAAYGFDVSLWEMLVPMVAGASLVIASEAESRDLRRLLGLVSRHGVSIVQFVPSMLNAIMLTGDVERKMSSLRIMVSSGEALTLKLVENLFKRLPGIRLFNFYGPAEAAICVAAREITPLDHEISFGKAIDNICLYVLDENHNEMIGEEITGRLAISGVGVGLGYLGKQCDEGGGFVANKFVAKDGWARMFITEDIVKRTRSGDYIFLGRAGRMDKIRGARVDLGEIEGVCLRHEMVIASHAIFNKSSGNAVGVSVACHCIEGADSANVKEEVFELCLKYLPDYMRPSHITMINEVPLTANGKVNLKEIFGFNKAANE